MIDKEIDKKQKVVLASSGFVWGIG